MSTHHIPLAVRYPYLTPRPRPGLSLTMFSMIIVTCLPHDSMLHFLPPQVTRPLIYSLRLPGRLGLKS